MQTLSPGSESPRSIPGTSETVRRAASAGDPVCALLRSAPDWCYSNITGELRVQAVG